MKFLDGIDTAPFSLETKEVPFKKTSKDLCGTFLVLRQHPEAKRDPVNNAEKDGTLREGAEPSAGDCCTSIGKAS